MATHDPVPVEDIELVILWSLWLQDSITDPTLQL